VAKEGPKFINPICFLVFAQILDQNSKKKRIKNQKPTKAEICLKKIIKSHHISLLFVGFRYLKPL
jgi:hypothetical protein